MQVAPEAAGRIARQQEMNSRAARAAAGSDMKHEEMHACNAKALS